jgi:hypothetical protein
MKRLRLVCLSIVAVALLGATLASSASAYLAFTTSRGLLPTPARLFKFWEWLIFAFSTASGSGSVSCSGATMTGVLETNAAKKDDAVIEETAFGGEGLGSDCESSLGPATITGSQEPWPNEFTEKKQWTIKGTKKVAFTVTFLALEGVSCTYEASKVKSTFNAGAAGHPEPVTVNTSDQVFKAAKKSNAACPKTGELSGSIKAVANGETLEAEIVGKTKK